MLVHRRLPPQLLLVPKLHLGGEKQEGLSVLLKDTEERIMVTQSSIEPGPPVLESGTLATTPAALPRFSTFYIL